MQHVPATIEEHLLLKSIKEESPWENLPKRLQATLSTKEEWHKRVMDHCIKKRLQWNTCFARKVSKEGEYYEEMMRYLRKNLALFPYHLAEYVCRVMRVSPFRYYCDMIYEVMRNEQPYDSIPNFSAADALRLTGIGRNEFIDIMNKCRSKKIMWKLNKSIAKELLPSQPANFTIEPWWGVCLVNFTLEEFRKLTEEEMATIDKICKEEANAFVLFDPEIIRGLYRRGLIYFDVPVYPDDRFKVSQLEGFISNREQSYEDPIEELLYAVFVVSSENATVAELAATLQADLSQLQAAASFACRLGWAVKVLDPSSVLQESNGPGYISSILSDEEDGSHASMSSADMSADGNAVPVVERQGPDKLRTISGPVRVAFIVDANITSFLMMGSVSPGLKSHAVTLYEAGKLGDASIGELCKDLQSLEGTKFEGELQEFANHAYSLRCTLECLRSGGVSADVAVDANDTMGILTSSSAEAASGTDENFIEESAIYSSTEVEEKINDHPLDLLSSGSVQIGSPADSYLLKSVVQEVGAISHSDYVNQNGNLDRENDLWKGGNTVLTESFSTGQNTIKKRRKYRVDILRCESLAGLAPVTLERLFHRDYDIIVSMVPLPSSSVLPGPSGPIHFGPPSYSSMTPWMKLALYSTVGNGPLSVVLMKGQCLRLLPAPLAGCQKALIWGWDGSAVGGLGGKFEGNLVNGNILLHCLNSLLKHSAVLVMPLSKHDLDDSERPITKDIPLPLRNVNGSIASVGEEMGLSKEETTKLNSLLIDLSNKIKLLTIGYIRLIKLYKKDESENASLDGQTYDWVPLSLEFGIPLFSPKLCGLICNRVVSSQLLQTDSLFDHHEAMQALRKRLRETCMEYQATGPVARLLYHREQQHARDSESPRQLVSYASGRWNSLLEPSLSISRSSSEHQRLKLLNRQRCRSEILSFDGSILRSYALSPVYEAATRPIDEPGLQEGSTVTKPEPDDSESKVVVLPGVNLLFDGSQLHPFDIGACLQARQPIALIAEASIASAALHQKKPS
ncbi:protein FAM91A1 isoform X1 [Amborella trichopoda]|uniref:protein FAM91A1 isoform X1 n=1 Tax=Amborella trichopoda TaxID=13333 RepID=UPI0005D31CD3|nr:protein FAM91A1 isoform X1 [Amborella trichopoda]XP_020528002.1 protein FAM91A1 isoform X1 [Amborella trichopoda]XP_020528004.1 protein FAM91A1 isoform X1 [Amborella trichopoda]XP_020528011.1 protein FAM91A1 isoform X1 [Amborella trichopoda]XP_020528016.1 protein FAM91A1 isoform X1 [Amborella trichopoda]XP_020528024.1 protein FAM91A1 isoform X1 [Amborella trichopoda]XP_020528028.1 protein FAM91A1 isoform X1 [Amborella trichopoda]|eukprot:XP_011626382.1 protein FAM91A1 isoform X1 [Amborella trichopoda]